MKNHEIDGFVLNESPQWERDDISPAILIGSSYNYFAVSKKRPDLKEELDQVMQKIERENPFYTDDLYKRYLSANSLETLTDEEQNWLEQHGAVRIGYLKNDVGISLVDTESEKPVGIINDYISLVSGYLGEQAIEFQLTGFESQEKELQALKDNRIDMIFHMNQNPYEAEQNDIVLSNTVFEINVAVLTGVKKFDENKENTVAVSRNNLLGKWYISFNYPFWKIKEYDSSAEADKAVQSGEADCFVVKAGQSLKTLEDSKMRSIFLTKSGASCFAVTRENTTLMNILNKTIQTLPASRLSSQFYVYENAPGKVTLAEYIKDNLRVVSIWFVSVVLIIVWIIVYLLIQARKAKIQAEKANAAKSEFLFNMSHDIRTQIIPHTGTKITGNMRYLFTFSKWEFIPVHTKTQQIIWNIIKTTPVIFCIILQLPCFRYGCQSLCNEVRSFRAFQLLSVTWHHPPVTVSDKVVHPPIFPVCHSL